MFINQLVYVICMVSQHYTVILFCLWGNNSALCDIDDVIICSDTFNLQIKDLVELFERPHIADKRYFDPQSALINCFVVIFIMSNRKWKIVISMKRSSFSQKLTVCVMIWRKLKIAQICYHTIIWKHEICLRINLMAIHI